MRGLNQKEENTNIKTATPEEFVNKLIIDAANARASDVHVDPFELKFKVRFRVDGVLNQIAEQSIESFEMIIRRFKILGQMDISDNRKPQDGRGQLVNPTTQKMIEFRLSTIPTIFGEALVLRFIDQSKVNENSKYITCSNCGWIHRKTEREGK